MAALFMRHEAADFDTWKKAYDQLDAERASMGVTGYGVHHHFDTMAAKAFMASDRLREVMKVAGVRSEPQAWFTTKF